MLVNAKAFKHTQMQTFESICVKTHVLQFHAAVKFSLQEGEFLVFVETDLEVLIQQYHYSLHQYIIIQMYRFDFSFITPVFSYNS